MLRKIALKIAKWLLRFAPDYREDWYKIVLDSQRINEKAEKVAACAEELLEENKQLRAAYDALLEEMAQLTEGQTW